MKIREYMEKNKLTHRAFAERCGISTATIFHFLSGRTKSISFPVIQKIVKGTNGRLTQESLLQEIFLAQQ
jgi:transcriptional regulator with XRE-family HTH domain